jgi:hypothetical protein
MERFWSTAAFALSISVAAAEASDTQPSLVDPVPLDANDLQSITLQVMQKNPLLSSSPGIKFASAQRGMGSTDIASLIYFPHTESAGIKQAFQVRCLRNAPGEQWTCEDPEIRRYLRLDSQDFEVRVLDNIGTEQALALIQATRRAVQASGTIGSVLPETAIMILRDGTDYVVSWGSLEGYEELEVRGRLKAGGNPAKAEDWVTVVVKSID